MTAGADTDVIAGRDQPPALAHSSRPRPAAAIGATDAPQTPATVNWRLIRRRPPPAGPRGRPVLRGQELGIRLNHWAPTGNEADRDAADFIRYFASLPETGAIAAYLEGFRHGPSFQRAIAAAARRGVPVVVVKIGRTEVGRSWAQSHTGHLAGADDVVSGLLRQYGVTRVDGLDELLDTAAMFARSAPPTA